jgi:GNAT superfamily N-acetyltransferase
MTPSNEDLDAEDAAAYVIRPLVPEDVPELAALHVKTFQETHGGMVTPANLRIREGQWRSLFDRDSATWFCFVVENAQAELIGFAKGIRHDDEGYSEYGGELNKLYLLRAYHRRGIGRRLIGFVAREFLARGISSMLLFGEARNPSNAFYETLGAQRLYAGNGEFHGGYGWTDLRALTAVC